MPEPDFTALFATLGPVGGAIVGLIWLIKYTGFGRIPDDPTRGDVLAEVKAMRRENAEESRAIRNEIMGVKEQVTELRARTQENIAEHGRRMDRLERRP